MYFYIMEVFLECIERAFCLQFILDKSLPGAVQTFSSRCCGCSEQGSAFGASSSPQLEAGALRRCCWFSFPVWPGCLPWESISSASPTRVSHPAGTKGCHSLLLCWGNLQPGAFPTIAAMQGLF